ncbi:helix-turn-helix domain-containing protein [Clostridiales bacterium]|nr:helix-turn-helix domain-containing protein [Clostridiales bacterium]
MTVTHKNTLLTGCPVKRVHIKYVLLHLDEHISLEGIEREYGVSHKLVSAWVKKYLEDGEDALEPHNGNPYAALHTSKSLSEVERLRLMVAKLEVENARLKKGYWVEGAGANKEYVTGKGKTTKSLKNSK